ncbi:MAG: ribonuclease III [Pseudomonadota bacterium]|nr:ribonuclease III [Pseudomonadota bacterium]
MSLTKDKLVALQEILNYQFGNINILIHALTHSSLKQKHGGQTYERLEFLGDRVLGLVIAEMLIDMFPSWPEGKLAPKLASMVSGRTLADVARTICLEDYILMSEGEIIAGNNLRQSVLADCCEAILGGIYSDGGLGKARLFVEHFWLPRIDLDGPEASKTELQEWAQGRGLPLPLYKILNREGPPHQPVFTVELTVEDCDIVIAEGGSKRAAEQAAATKLLKQLIKIS